MKVVEINRNGWRLLLVEHYIIANIGNARTTGTFFICGGASRRSGDGYINTANAGLHGE